MAHQGFCVSWFFQGSLGKMLGFMTWVGGVWGEGGVTLGAWGPQGQTA